VISGVVLAAGLGSRFGGTKQLAEVGGVPLVLHAVSALRDGGVDEIVVVTGHDADAVEAVLPDDARPVRNDAYREGQASSLAAGLHELDASSEAAIVLMADQPGVTAEEVASLIVGFRATRSRIVRLRYSDGPGPALLSREVHAEAGHLHGDVGASVLIASHPEWVHEVVADRPAPPDVDEPADPPGGRRARHIRRVRGPRSPRRASRRSARRPPGPTTAPGTIRATGS
jgi:molybdenum cofactor cytidylyltransferase